jgi:hypothetical protein
MLAASTVRRILVALVAAICLIGATVAAVVWHDAQALHPVQVAAVSDVSPVIQPAPTSSSTSTSTTSTSTSTSTTSTTLKPRPVPTTAAPRVTVPATTPATTPVTAPAAPAGGSPQERCAAARQWVEAHGLLLPAGWAFRCPGEALVAGTDRWGVACWNCDSSGSWIAVDVGRIGASDATLRYVIAHETCHSLDYTTLGITTELGADLCAALHGAPRP